MGHLDSVRDRRGVPDALAIPERVPFSWDSANYALAVQRSTSPLTGPIHPVIWVTLSSARAIDAGRWNINDSLVLWNIIATALAAMLLVRFAWELAEDDPLRTLFAASAGALMIFSPLFWFYGESLRSTRPRRSLRSCLAFFAWKPAAGSRERPTRAALSIPLAAAFKLTRRYVGAARRLRVETGAADDPRQGALALFFVCAAAVGRGVPARGAGPGYVDLAAVRLGHSDVTAGGDAGQKTRWNA